MNYRKLGNTGMRVSEVGLGCEHMQGLPFEVNEAIIRTAAEGGVNIFDIFMAEPTIRDQLGKLFQPIRRDIVLQMHFGVGWKDDQYFRTRDMDICRHFYEDWFHRYHTDYADLTMIHFIDTEEDLEIVLHGGTVDFLQAEKKAGRIRGIGMGSHNPVVARKAVEAGFLDSLMFSLCPAFDLLPEDFDFTDPDKLFSGATYQSDDMRGVNPARAALYQTCEARGVGITVMKTLGAGTLLSAETSPFGTALTVPQCIHYALTRPAVASVMIGVKTPEQVTEALRYETTPDAERDYSVVLASTPKFAMTGKCMYCNHCQPCAVGIDIAQVNKYLDMALLSPEVPATLRAHYEALTPNAADCVSCGDCETRCPFGVGIVARMEKAREIF